MKRFGILKRITVGLLSAVVLTSSIPHYSYALDSDVPESEGSFDDAMKIETFVGPEDEEVIEPEECEHADEEAMDDWEEPSREPCEDCEAEDMTEDAAEGSEDGEFAEDTEDAENIEDAGDAESSEEVDETGTDTEEISESEFPSMEELEDIEDVHHHEDSSELMSIEDTTELTEEEKKAYAGKNTSGFWIDGIDPEGYTYASSPVTISGLKVYFGGQPLVEGRDYTIAFKNNTKPGYGAVVVTGKGNYSGSYTELFKIKKGQGSEVNATALTAKNTSIANFAATLVYNGQSQRQEEAVIYYNTDTPLTRGIDYVVSFNKDPVNAGSYTAFYTGIGSYKGTLKKTFKIIPLKMSGEFIDYVLYPGQSNPTVPYRKGGARPEVTVSLDEDNELILGVDYTVTYKNNTKAGAVGTVNVTGKGNLTGTVSRSFTIGKNTDLESLTVIAQDKAYTAKAGNYFTGVTITDCDGKKLSAGADYSKNFVFRYAQDTELSNGVTRYEGDVASASDMVPPGAVMELSVTLNGSYSGTVSDTYRIVGQDISKATVKVGAQFFTGEPVCPDKSQITVTLGKMALSEDDYDIISYENNDKKGTGKLTIRGRGEYGGTKTANFTIAARTTSYMISFYGNGATSGAMSNQQMKLEKETKLTSNKYARVNYTFIGWNTEADGSGQAYSNQQAITPKYSGGNSGEVLRLYAQWRPNSVQNYKITYHYNNGKTGDRVETYNAFSGTIAVTAPEKELWQSGYQFAGWYKENTFKNKITSIKAGSTGNVDLYAKWLPYNYLVRFDGNGATSGSMADQALSFGVYKNLTKNSFVKSGSAFMGWTTQKGSTLVEFTDEQMVKDLSEAKDGSGDVVTLYAVWNSSFDIVYELGEDAAFGKPGYPTSYSYGTTTTLSNYVPVRRGFDFGGWFADESFKKKLDVIPAISSGTVTAYAKWTPWTYKIQYNAGADATGKMSLQTVKTEKATMAACGFKIEGNSFAYWNTKADGSGASFYAGQLVGRQDLCAEEKNGTVDLYAVWESASSYAKRYGGKTEYTINFDANGYSASPGAAVSGKMSALKVSYGQTKSLTKNAYVIKGYDFVEWNTNKNGSGNSFEDMAQVMDLDQKLSGSVTLYAIWKKQEYTITYENLIDGNGGNPTSYTGGSDAITLKAPGSFGQTFAGWYSDAALKKKATGIPKGSTGDKVFYAKWNTSYCNISYNLNYDKAPVPVLDTSRAGFVSSGDSRDYVFATAKRQGYRFGGWFKEAACKTPVTTIPNTATVDMTVYAKWIADCQHSYVSSDVIKEATCTEDGHGTLTCRYCGATNKDVTIPKLGHVKKLTKDIAATCTTDGVKEYTCERCGTVISSETIPKLGHKEKLTKNTEATCTADGAKIYTCDRCKATLRTETTPKLGHKEKLTKTVQPTCSMDGSRVYSCENCGETVRTEKIPKLEHKESVKETKEPTCTAEGSITYHCEVCNQSSRTETIPKLGHSFKLTETKEPTCGMPGSHTYVCERCELKLTERIPATGHDYAWVTVKEATTSSIGEKNYKCRTCGNVKNYESIPRLTKACNHEEQVKIVLKEATCTESAHYQIECKDCGHIIDEDYVDPHGEKNADNHADVEVISTEDATFTTEGKRSCHCKACDSSFTEVIPVIECTHSSRTKHEKLGKGYTDCYYCGKVLEEYDIDQDSCSHYYGKTYIERIAADAVNWGETDAVCSRCGKVMSTTKVHPYQAYQVEGKDGETYVLYGWFDYEYAKEVWELTNEYRVASGTTKLSYNESLQYASDIRALESAVLFDHSRPNGTRWNTIDPKWQYGGENIASGYTDPADVMVGWKNSPGHDRNLKYGVESNQTPFKGISVGVFHRYTYLDSMPGRIFETVVWAQNFTFYEY